MNNDFHILLAIDLKRGTDQLLEESVRYGQAFKAIVDVVHIVPPDPDFVGYLKSDDFETHNRDYQAHTLRSQRRQIQDIGDRLKAAGVRVGQALTVQGPILETIIEHVHKLRPNLLILGSHQHRTLYRLWYGDTAVDAAKRAPCTLLLVPVDGHS
jgi:nucleotide-binding universal stress UspA family protein